MKKDYLPLSPDEHDATELALVERQWTAIWQDQPKEWTAIVARVAQREEYRLMAPYLNRLGAGARILDGGCGLGEWTVSLAARGYELYSVDVARQTLALLRREFPQQRFLCADIRRLCFGTGFFDAYFSWGVFEHFEDGLGSCIAEAWRVLRPGGYLFISVPFQNWRHIVRATRLPRPLNGSDHQQNGCGSRMRFYQWRLTMPELEQELVMRGFRLINIRPISMREGVSRTLTHELRLRAGTFVHKAAARLLAPLLPKRGFAHMIMAIAERAAAETGN
jgi:SAM-dependent methyltransferase